jgi:carboxyl-terminal processing protease
VGVDGDVHAAPIAFPRAFSSTMTRTFWLASLLVSLASTLAPARAADFTLGDLLELDEAYVTIADHAVSPVPAAALVAGARRGIADVLRASAVVNPQVADVHARPDGRGVVPAEERAIALALQRYGARVAPRELIAGAIRGELAALHDPYAVFFSAADVKGFSRALDGSAFGGIGIELAFDRAAQRWRAESVFPGGPAAKAGVRDGDELQAVDDTPLAGLPDARVSALLRGEIGSSVRLTLVRDGAVLPEPVVVTRAAVTPPVVTARLLDGGIGYVALHGFPLDAATQLRAAFVRLAARGAQRDVLDLRGNGGGYETAAVHVASLFIASGPVVAMQPRRGPRAVTRADGNPLPPMPLVVLIDHDSASGAELVAGALQDRKRATLVGTRSFGKGVAQELFPLPDGAAIKLTTMRYYTAGGRFIDRTGLAPDVAVDEPADAVRGTPGRDPQLDRALAVVAASDMIAR